MVTSPAFFSCDVVLKCDAASDGLDGNKIHADNQTGERHVLFCHLGKNEFIICYLILTIKGKHSRHVGIFAFILQWLYDIYLSKCL